MEKTELLYILTVSILGLFSASSYALNPIDEKPIAIEGKNYETSEKQAETLKWIRELKEKLSQSIEPYREIGESLQKDARFKIEDFQCGCSALQNDFLPALPYQKEDIVNALPMNFPKNAPKTAVYVFVSLSMPKPALIALNKEAAQFGATLVLRGLKDNSYQRTVLYLQEMIQKTGQGFVIHPELFKRYGILQVPSVVLTTDTNGAEPIFDVVSGHIPIKTALLEINQKGELKDEAKAWLSRGGYAD